MSRSFSIRLLVGGSIAAALAALAAIAPIGSTRAQVPKVSADPSPQEAVSEARSRASEDIEMLGQVVAARTTALRQAEASLDLERKEQGEYAKLKKFGITSEIGRLQVELQVLERESDRAIRQSELAEAKARLEQARRRLATIGDRGESGPGLLETIGRDLDRTVGRVDRIDARLDRVGASLAALRADLHRLEASIDELRRDRKADRP